MRWLCIDECSWTTKRGKRLPCPMCTGYCSEEQAAKKAWWHARDIKDQQADRLAYKASVAAAHGKCAAATEIAGAA